MGLGRRVGEPVKVILPFDSSIKLGSNYEKYKESGFDERHLVLDPDDPPCRFLIRQLTDEMQDIIGTQPFVRTEAQWRVRCGLLHPENYAILRADGTPAMPPKRDTEITPSGVEVLTVKYMRELALLPEQLTALGDLIHYYSVITGPLPQPSEPPSGERPGQEAAAGSKPSPGQSAAGDAQ